MPAAVIYTRVSSQEQVSNFSLGTQEDGCRAFCERQGWAVDQVFVERGESAKTSERTEFQRMLAYCREHQDRVAFVVVYNLSRFARNQYDHHVIRALLHQLGIGLRSVTEPVDESPLGDMLSGILGAVHEFDNSLRRTRAIEGMKAALRAGKWCWLAPFGYRQESGVLQPVPAEAAVVSEAYRRVAAGEAVDAVYRELRERGLAPMRRSDFYKIMRSPLYSGIVESRSWGIRAQGQHEAIVDQDLWDRAQLAQGGSGYRQQHPDFPLRRFVRCGHCGRPFTGGWSRGRGRMYAYYRCSGGSGCPTGNVPAAKVEDAFIDELRGARPGAQFLSLFRRIALDRLADQKEEQAEIRRAAEWKDRTLEKQRQRLVQAYIYDAAIDEATYRAELDRLREEESLNRVRRHHAELDELDAEGLLAFAERLIADAPRLWANLEPEQKQKLQRFIFPEGLTWMDDGFLNPVKSLMYQGLPAAEGVGLQTGRGERI